MIRPGEIQKRAHKVGVRDSQIEKDYILSWILNGIANHADLSKEIGWGINSKRALLDRLVQRSEEE